MGLEDQIGGPSQRLLDFTGRPVTLTNAEAETDANGDVIRDEYGDVNWVENSISTRAEFEYPGSPQFQSRVGGDAADIDALVFVPIDVGADDYPNAPGGPPPGVFTGQEDEHIRQTEIYDEKGEETFEVRAYVDENNGRARLHAVR